MGRLAVVTIVIGDRHRQISKLTMPSQKKYAQKNGADFIVYDGESYNFFYFDGSEGKKIPFKNVALSLSKGLSDYSAGAHNKFNLVELLKDYERVLYLDADIIIREDSDSIFDKVPVNSVGIFEEGKYLDRGDFLPNISREMGEPIVGNDSKYYNTGVILFSRGHESLFEIPSRPYDDGFFEQTLLNWNIFKNNIPVFEISYKYNRMMFVDRFIKETRHDSYFIHYAGSWMLLGEGHSKNPETLLGIIKSDIELWNRTAPEYKHKNVYLDVPNTFWEKAVV